MWPEITAKILKKLNKINVNIPQPLPVAFQHRLLIHGVITQQLITEGVRLQPDCAPAAACSPNIPAAQINRSSSLHIAAYQDEEEEEEESEKGM